MGAISLCSPLPHSSMWCCALISHKKNNWNISSIVQVWQQTELCFLCNSALTLPHGEKHAELLTLCTWSSFCTFVKFLFSFPHRLLLVLKCINLWYAPVPGSYLERFTAVGNKTIWPDESFSYWQITHERAHTRRDTASTLTVTADDLVNTFHSRFCFIMFSLFCALFCPVFAFVGGCGFSS